MVPSSRVIRWLNRITRKILIRAKKITILVLVDLENILVNTEISTEVSITKRFDEFLEWLGKIGKIAGVFVFSPHHLIPQFEKYFFDRKFFIILCPKIFQEEEQESIDTVDATLTEFGRKMLSQISSLTHLCLCSGDAGFLNCSWSEDKNCLPLLKEAEKAGLRIIIGAGNLTSLSSELIPLAEIDPETNRRRVFIFSSDN